MAAGKEKLKRNNGEGNLNLPLDDDDDDDDDHDIDNGAKKRAASNKKGMVKNIPDPMEAFAPGMVDEVQEENVCSQREWDS